jgi:hypothetical protein
MKIHITADRFWFDNSSIERWPEILLNLPQIMEATSKYDIAKKYLSYPTDEKGRILRSDEFYGLFGAEEKQGRTIISGVNYIEKRVDGYYLTEDALLLRDCYQDDNNWEIRLAKQLLMYSIRVRAVVLGIFNSEGICFPGKFLNKNKEAYIKFEGERYFLLNSKNTELNLNDFLKKIEPHSLGPFWKKELEIKEDDKIQIVGTTKEAPSLSEVGTYLKMPLTLFQYLEWFKEVNEGVYGFHKEKLKIDVGEEIFNSLLLDGFKKDIDILRNLISEYGDIRGYFPVEEVGVILKRQIAPEHKVSAPRWIDHYFMEGIESGKFKLVGTEQGQPRHGRGLLGDKEKQLLKLDF